MIDLNRLVLWSLLENDCFVLPGKGGFVVRNEMASMDDGGSFTPPRRTIGFNTSLTMTDGVLAQNIMQMCDTDYASAVRMLDEALADADCILQTEGKWSIPEVGEFSLSDTGAWEFEPALEEGIVAPDYFGLESVHTELFSNLQVPVVSESLPLSNVSMKESAEEKVEWDDAEESMIVHWSRPLRYVAVAAVAVVLLLFVSLPSAQTPSVSIAEGALFSFPVIPHRQVAVQEMPVPVKEKDIRPAAVVQNPAEVKEPVAQSIVEEEPSKTCFTLVLASKVKENNAHGLVHRLSRKGFDKAAVYVKGKMTRVVYSSYGSEEEAIDSLRKLRAEDDLFREAWVLECESPLPIVEKHGQGGAS